MAIFSYWRMKWQGKRDGRPWRWVLWPIWKSPKEPRPAQDRLEPCIVEYQVKDAAQVDIQTLSRKWAEEEHELEPAIEKQSEKVRDLEDRYALEREEVTLARKAYEEAVAKYRELLPPSFRAGWMYFFLVFLGVVELPLNALVFSILADTPLYTYIFALAIFVIPLSAHFVGQSLRQEDKTRTDQALLVVIPAVVLTCLLGFGFLRGEYLAAVLSRMKTLGLAIGPTTATIIFVAFNLTIFTVAVFISYAGSHPQHRLYRQRRHELLEAQKRYYVERSEAEVLGKLVSEARLILTEMKHKRDRRRVVYYEKAEALKATAKFYIDTYREANEKWRPWPVPPRGFDGPPLVPEIPENLRISDRIIGSQIMQL